MALKGRIFRESSGRLFHADEQLALPRAKAHRPTKQLVAIELRLRFAVANSNHDLVRPECRYHRAALRVPDDVPLDFRHGYSIIGKAADDLKAVLFLRMPDDVDTPHGRARSSERLGVGTSKPLFDKWHHLAMAYCEQLLCERA